MRHQAQQKIHTCTYIRTGHAYVNKYIHNYIHTYTSYKHVAFAQLNTHTSVCLSVRPSVCISVCPCIWLFILTVCLSVRPSVSLSMSVRLSVLQYVCLSIRL